MAKRLMNNVLLTIASVLVCSLASCSGTGSAGEVPAARTVTYKCLSSSCDAVVTLSEADPVPEHCGKRMIR